MTGLHHALLSLEKYHCIAVMPVGIFFIGNSCGLKSQVANSHSQTGKCCHRPVEAEFVAQWPPFLIENIVYIGIGRNLGD
ncbi:hypothetical protein SRABI106_03805 [Rahnella aquatilis]|nr:hypothetical protein SRABI106_03805 [Rahnella aquatilis]